MKLRVCITFLIVFLAIHHAFTPALRSAPADSVAQKPAVFADSDRAQKVHATAVAVDAIFKKHMESRHLPGLVYGVVLDGQLIYSGGFGYANLEQQIPANTKSLFRIA